MLPTLSIFIIIWYTHVRALPPLTRALLCCQGQFEPKAKEGESPKSLTEYYSKLNQKYYRFRPDLCYPGHIMKEQSNHTILTGTIFGHPVRLVLPAPVRVPTPEELEAMFDDADEDRYSTTDLEYYKNTPAIR